MLLADGTGVSGGVATGIGSIIKSLVLGLGLANSVIIFSVIGIIIAIIFYIRYVLPVRAATKQTQEVKAKEQERFKSSTTAASVEHLETLKKLDTDVKLLYQRIGALERITENNCCDIKQQLAEVYRMNTSIAKTNGEVDTIQQSINDVRSTAESISADVRMLMQHLLPPGRQ